MHSPSRAIPTAALALALLGLPAAARADYVLTPWQTLVAPTAKTSYNVVLPFQQFDATLGTLKQVDISFTGMLHGDFTDTYGGAGTPTITDTGHGSLTLTGPQGLNLVTPIDITTGPVTLSSGSISLSKDQSLSVTGAVTDPNGLAAFTGVGTVNLDVIGGTFLTGYTVSNGNGRGTIVLSDGATAMVRYEYLPVNPSPGGGGGNGTPEPASLMLLATGAGALLLAGPAQGVATGSDARRFRGSGRLTAAGRR